MVFLNLSENKIGTRGVQCLTSCLHNIMDLEIANCCLLENDMALLANAIQGLKTPVSVHAAGKQFKIENAYFYNKFLTFALIT